MKRVQPGQQQFADPFRPAEVHDVGLIVRKLSQSSELFWASVDMESDGLGLPGGQAEAWNLECTLDCFDRRLTVRVRDIDRHRPDLLPGGLLGSQNGGEI